jgi:hypothetical protein
MAAVYRILHVPTSMYFCPSREVRVKLADLPSYYGSGTIAVKSNLSKTGKTYLKLPTIKQIGQRYYTHLFNSVTDMAPGTHYCVRAVVVDEWVVEEMA